MDEELKARWVEALRSGDYTQGRRALYNPTDNTYCCLGVLCDVMGREVVPFDPSEADANDNAVNCAAYYELGTALTNIGLDELMSMNDATDAHHRDFNGIADWIEENL